MAGHCDAPGYPCVLDTVGKMVSDGYRLAAYCDRPCGGAGDWVDMKALVARAGRDHPCDADSLAKVLPCPICGTGMRVRLHPPNTPTAGGAHSLG